MCVLLFKAYWFHSLLLSLDVGVAALIVTTVAFYDICRPALSPCYSLLCVPSWKNRHQILTA